MLTNLGNWVTATYIWMAGSLMLAGCVPLQVGQGGRVLAEGVALQSVVVTPIPQPKVIRATSLELLVRATDRGAVKPRFPEIPAIDNCQ